MRKITALLIALLLCTAAVSALAELEYVNPDTGYRAVIQDDIDLLTNEEEQALMREMIPLTEKTNAAFWTTDKAYSESKARNNAERKHIELFGNYVNGTVFMIDMNARYMFLDTEGWIQGVVRKELAEIITNNERGTVQAERYYSAARDVFTQVQRLVDGKRIREPMRYLSSAVIAMMGGLLASLILVLILRRYRVPSALNAARARIQMLVDKVNIADIEKTFIPDGPIEVHVSVYVPESSCSSCGVSCGGGSSCGGGGGGGCGGGGGGGSCGGGSSF